MYTNTDLPSHILFASIEASNLSHTVSALDGDRPLIYVNETFLKETGYSKSEVLGKNCRFLQGEGTDPETIEKIRGALKNIEPLEIDILNYRKDGSSFWNHLYISPVYNAEGKPTAFIGIQSNVTHIYEQQRIESERQKLEALGRLSANLNHEVKNVLQPISLMGDMLADWPELSDDERTNCVNVIRQNASIANRVTREILQFARPSTADAEPYPAHKLATEMQHFTQSLLHSRIHFTANIQDASDEAVQLKVNVTQLQQVILNLINNALHAMQDTGSMQFTWTYEVLDKKPYACMALKDSGEGMPPETLAQIFEPFYSTKPPGEGTGLGLTLSRRMIQAWGGDLLAQSKQGEGTVFTAHFPIVG